MDLHTQPLAVLKEDLQQLGQVTYGENDFVYAVTLQLP
jgi:hypothetical protein